MEIIKKGSQLIFWAICIGMFGWTFVKTLLNHLEYKTIQTSVDKPTNLSFSFPSIALCLKSAFKDSDRPMLTLEDYDENTYDPMETLNVTGYSFYYIDREESDYPYLSRDLIQPTTFRTLAFGRCLMYRALKDKVSRPILLLR